MLKDCDHDVLKGTSICARCPKPDDWQQLANCLSGDPDRFYPPDTTDPALTQEAKSICRDCPVKGFCLEDGWSDKYGIWAGFTPEERVYLRTLFVLPKRKSDQREMIRIVAHRFN
jgi:hypothetical protein